jgi:hypothetical protein
MNEIQCIIPQKKEKNIIYISNYPKNLKIKKEKDPCEYLDERKSVKKN